MSRYAYRRLCRLRAEYGYVVCCTGLCVLESVYNTGYMGFGVCTRPVGDLPAQELSGYAYRRLYRLRAEYGKSNALHRSSRIRSICNSQRERPLCVAQWSLSLCWHLLIVPGRFQPSIVSTSELNCRVRDGNGCTLTVISTNYFYPQDFPSLNRHYQPPTSTLFAPAKCGLSKPASEYRTSSTSSNSRTLKTG